MKARTLRAARKLVTPMLVLTGATACSPGYVMRAGWEEAKLLSRRQPIHQAVRDTSTSAALRAKLQLVQTARDYAERVLGLSPGGSFTSFVRLPRDTLALNISAAPEFELRWKTWWFPIVGRVPYKGYFDFDRALEEARRLDGSGYDVSVRPVSAFSTLGWLPDPVMSTTLRLDSVALVETVIHEITHSTFFPPGQARFNESFANFVGHRGAIDFFCDGLREEAPCRRARARWHDTPVIGRVTEMPAAEKRARKREAFREAARTFREEVRPRLRAGTYGDLDPERLDNAWVLSRLLYYTRLDDFEELHRRRDGRLAAVVEHLMGAAADSGDPWSALDRLLADADVAGGE